MASLIRRLSGRSLGFFAALSFLAGSAAAPLRAQAPQEYQVKAVFLLNFAQFVEWPAAAFADANAPLVFGVLGEDPFGTALEDVVRDERVQGHPLVVRHFHRAQDVRDCQILFVAAPENARLEATLTVLPVRHVLTVGDTADFAQRGGAIGFRTAQNKIRLRINLAAAKSAELTISSKLLRAAELVGAPGGALP